MLVAACVATTAQAGPVGERHLTTTDATAALRDADHKPTVRVTVWYPAAEGAQEERIDIGPPMASRCSSSARWPPDAPFVDDQARGR